MKIIGNFFIVIMIALSFSTTVSAQKKDKLNVLDYYRMIPDNALENETIKGKIIVSDIQNGYLKIEGLFEGFIEAALFRKKNGSALLLIGETGCGPVCDTILTAYDFSGKEMKNVTADILPFLSAEDAIIIYNQKKTDKDDNAEDINVPQIYELPRIGRVIKVKADTTFAPSDITLYELHFKNDKFVVVK